MPPQPGRCWTVSFGGDSRFSSGERVFLSAVTGSGVTALSAAALGLAGVYSKWSLLLSWVCICLVAAACRVRSSRMGGAGLKGWALIALLVAAALALFLPPNRVVFGWNDDGVYADMAARLAREGDIYAEVDTVREVAPERRDLVFVPNPEEGRDFQAYLYKQYFITDFGSGKVVPQFFYPWPALMAVFATFLGLQRMFYAVTFAALLYLGGVFLVARRMLGRPWSAAVLLLALLSPLLLYFSRYTTSEALTGAFFLAAVLPALGRGPLVPWGRREAALSALLLTMAFLTRIDMLLLLAPLAASFAWKGIKGEWRGADTVFSLLCAGGRAWPCWRGASPPPPISPSSSAIIAPRRGGWRRWACRSWPFCCWRWPYGPPLSGRRRQRSWRGGASLPS